MAETLRKRCKISAGRLNGELLGCPHVLRKVGKKHTLRPAFGQKVQKKKHRSFVFAGDLKKEPEVR